MSRRRKRRLDDSRPRESGSETFQDMLFSLVAVLLASIAYANSNDSSGTDLSQGVPVTLSENGEIQVDQNPSEESRLLDTVAVQINEERPHVNFFAHPATRTGDAARVELLLQSRFRVVRVIEKD